MADQWTCSDCGERVADTYAECWNCQSTRPGYSSQAEQIKRFQGQQDDTARQSRIADEIQADMIRQNEIADQLQEEMRSQNRAFDKILALQLSNQERFERLLSRWEKITDAVERKTGE